MTHPELIDDINKDLSILLPAKMSLEELQQRLAEHINELIKTDFHKLIALLYRIDVSEPKLKQLLQQQPGKDTGDLIAELIIERQLQKIKSRKQFSQRDNDLPGEEKW